MRDTATGCGRGSGEPPAAGTSAHPPDPTGPGQAGQSNDVGLNAFTRTRLGTHLRAMYDQVVQQPVPQRFSDLIARLEAGDPIRSAGAEPEA